MLFREDVQARMLHENDNVIVYDDYSNLLAKCAIKELPKCYGIDLLQCEVLSLDVTVNCYGLKVGVLC